MNKKAFLSASLLAIFAVGIVAMAIPASASVYGTLSITKPDMVVPGGAIEIDITGFSSTGGTIYFYLSKDDDPEISTGDVYLTSMTRSDVEDELPYITLAVPTTISADDYYAKVTDIKRVGADAIVSDETVEVIPEEEWPTITVDPESDTVPTELEEVKGEDILDDWEMLTATLFWEDYEEEIASVDVEDYEEFTAEDVPIPEAFMGKHKILVLLEDDDSLGTFVEFEVESSVALTLPADFSVEAEELDQEVIIEAHGFPEGTLDADTIKFVAKDIKTGGTIETITADHDEIDVNDEDPLKGTFFDLSAIVDEVPEGIINMQFKVNGETFTLEDQLLSSTDSDPGKFKGRMDVTSGEIGDDVTFYVIDFPAGVEVDVTFKNDVSISLKDIGEPLTPADDYGAFKYTFELKDLPGGTYDVIAEDVDNHRTKSIGTFKLLHTIKFLDVDLEEIEECFVGDGEEGTEDDIKIEGKAFPVGATFTKILIGGEEVEYWTYPEPELEIDEDGLFDSGWIEVPHASGGGKEVPVEIKGKDADGKAITLESKIIIDPRLEVISVEDETGVLVLDYTGDWEDYRVATIFGGNPMKITGVGFLAGETVTVTFSSEDKDIEEKALIMHGGKAESDGDLEVVFMLPRTSALAKTIGDGDIEVAGPTTTNKDAVYDRFEEYLVISALSDADAKIFFNLQDDGSLELEDVHVGDIVRVVGVGFKTKSLALEIEGEKVGEVTSSYGFFDTKVTIPELQRADLEYVVEETETGRTSTEFSIKSKVTLSISKAGPGVTVTAYGTGFVEDEDTDINWEALPTLATGEGDEDGNWEANFTVPEVAPGSYKITFDAEELDAEDDPTLTFFVIGPLRIAALSLPTEVYNGSSVVITVVVQDYFGVTVPGATVTGSITPPVGAAVPLTFTEVEAGIYSATYKVPVDAKEGTYRVSVKASKPVAGGDATATGAFHVSISVPPAPPPVIPPPVDIKPILDKMVALSSDVASLAKSVAGLSSDVASLAKSVAGLTTDVSDLHKSVSDLQASVRAMPVVPLEWIYAIAIIAIIAAIASIAAVISIYRKIA